MNESNAVLKYMNRVINLGEFICTLGPPFESSVDVDFIPFPTEIESVQHVNKTSFAQPATLANIPNNNAINVSEICYCCCLVADCFHCHEGDFYSANRPYNSNSKYL